MPKGSAVQLDLRPFDDPEASESLRARYPRLMEYLGALPAGIHSYPECQSRAGLLGSVLARESRREAAPEPFVEALLRPATTPWVPEVRFNAALLAIADAESMSDAQHLRWARATNGQLYHGLLYRALMAMFSPAVLLERAASRWDSFHRGSRLEVTGTHAGEARAVLTFPARLYTRLLLGGCGEAFAAAFEHSRGRDVTVELLEATEISGLFRCRWR